MRMRILLAVTASAFSTCLTGVARQRTGHPHMGLGSATTSIRAAGRRRARPSPGRFPDCPNGEINCLDPGGFGAVTITKAISIVCQYTEGGAVVTLGSNGIIVNAPADAAGLSPAASTSRGPIPASTACASSPANRSRSRIRSSATSARSTARVCSCTHRDFDAPYHRHDHCQQRQCGDRRRSADPAERRRGGDRDPAQRQRHDQRQCRGARERGLDRDDHELAGGLQCQFRHSHRERLADRPGRRDDDHRQWYRRLGRRRARSKATAPTSSTAIPATRSSASTA